MALADVRISDRLTDLNPVVVPDVGNLKVSWEMSRAGQMTFDIPVRDVPPALPITNLISKWIRYTHPTAGDWGGVIISANPQDGLLSVSAESWAAMLRGVVTVAGYAGGGLQGAIQSAAVSQPHGILRGVSVLQGANFIPDVSFYAAEQDILDALLPAYLDAYLQQNGWLITGIQGAGWNVDPIARTFNFYHQYGRDLTATVGLHDGVHNVTSGWSDDADDIFNRIALYAAHNYTVYIQEEFTDYHQVPNTNALTRWKRTNRKKPKPPATIKEPFTNYRQVPQTGIAAEPAYGNVVASQARYGVRNARIAQSDITYATFQLKQNAANALAVQFARNEQLVTVECADVDSIWAQFREGDMIGVTLSNNGVQGRMVARVRALDLSPGRGVMTVSGEAELT